MTRLRYTFRHERDSEGPSAHGFWISSCSFPGWMDADELTVDLDFGALAPAADTLLMVREGDERRYFRVLRIDSAPAPPPAAVSTAEDEALLIGGPAHGARLRLPHRPEAIEIPLRTKAPALGDAPIEATAALRVARYRRQTIHFAGEGDIAFYAAADLSPRRAVVEALELAAGNRTGG